MGLTVFSDDYYMGEAIKEALKARDAGEVPVGAVIVCDNVIVARSHNLTQRLNDVTAHAEMQAFTAASEYLGGKYLRDCTLFVTLEPCVMCAGAALWTQIDKIVVGAMDEKNGFSRYSNNILHPKTKYITGIREKECAMLLSDFFKQRR